MQEMKHSKAPLRPKLAFHPALRTAKSSTRFVRGYPPAVPLADELFAKDKSITAQLGIIESAYRRTVRGLHD